MTAVATPAGAVSHPEVDWHAINWQKAHTLVRRLQARIVKAIQAGRWGKVRALQRLLTHSFCAKMLAVKRVTENQGKRTPGVDGVIWETPQKKAKAVMALGKRGYRPLPLRRIYIAKSSGTGQRPLSIPMAYAYCISLPRRLGIAVAAPTSANSLYQLTQYSGLAVADQVDSYKTSG
jgi:RNA-directed DNA polymerase